MFFHKQIKFQNLARFSGYDLKAHKSHIMLSLCLIFQGAGLPICSSVAREGGRATTPRRKKEGKTCFQHVYAICLQQ